MKINESISSVLFLPIFLLLPASLLFFGLTPELSFPGLLMIVLWVIVIAGGSFLFQIIIKWQKSRKFKFFITFPAMALILLVVWFISLRISSVLWGSVPAWDAKWIILLFSAMYFWANFLLEERDRANREKCAQIENSLIRKEMELEFMKTQFNPHFLFNSLNNVAATIMVNRDLALEYTYKLSEMLRYQVGVSGRETVGILEEDTYIRNYLDVERLRLGDRYSIEYISEIISGGVSLPPYLLHPLIEQALRQSKGLNGKSSIIIKLKVSLKEIRLNITFTFTNSPAQEKLRTEGFQMVSKRLKLLYPERHSLIEIKKNNSMEIDLMISLN